MQRNLWASISTNIAVYGYVMYVEELIGPDTVNTVPPQTLVAFLEHGQVRLSLEEDLEGARQTLAELEKMGILMKTVTSELEEQGVKSFSDAFTVLLEAVDKRRQAATAE